MQFKELSYEMDGAVGVITLRRPEAMNSLTYTLYMELEDAVRSSSAAALIITGEGRAFCAGDDVKQILGGTAGPPPEAIERGKKTGGLTPAADALLHTDIPVIAAINGPAVGWGMELAIMADIRVASERAKFAELFVVRGLCCDAAGLGRLAQIVGREWAAELLFTGEVIDAEKAKEIRLVSRVVPHEQLLPDRDGDRAEDRGQPAARGEGVESGAAPYARSRLARHRLVGHCANLRIAQDGGFEGERPLVPGKASAEVCRPLKLAPRHIR